MRFILRILANSLAIYLAAYFIPGVTAQTQATWKFFILSGFILALINTIIKPVLKLIALPLIILTFGLFSFVINVGTIWLLTKFIPQLIISGLMAFVLTAALITVANSLINFLIQKNNSK
jgi:putative membrane protein